MWCYTGKDEWKGGISLGKKKWEGLFRTEDERRGRRRASLASWCSHGAPREPRRESRAAMTKRLKGAARDDTSDEE